MSSISILDDKRVFHGASPISDDAPAGTDVRAQPEFEEIEAEIRRMEIDGPGAVNWRKVSSGSLDILSSRSKDLLVACWATVGLFRTEGYAGLAVGLGVLHGIVDVHWDGLFPPIKRERARVAAVDWLAGRITPLIVATPPVEADNPAVLAAYDALDELDRSMGQKLQKEQLTIGELFRALKPHAEQAKRAAQAAAERAAEAARAAEKALEDAAKAPEPAATPAGTSPAAAETRSAPVAAATGDWPSFADGLPEMLRNAATALRAASFADPRPYLFNRIGSWLRFDALPPAGGGQTMVFPPTDGITAIESLRSAGRHADAVHAAEELVWSAPFCVDSHRHAFEALAELGPAHEPACTAIRAAVALLTQRFPAILTLSFNDGRPFADEQTQAWAAQGGGGGGAPARDAIDDAIGEAHKLIGAGQVQEAFDALARPVAAAPNARTRFVRQLAQAGFCIDRGFIVTAIPLLDHLENVAAEQRLDAWEPELALRVAELRFRALTHSDAQQLVDDGRRRAAFETIRVRVAQLDIGVAARLGRN